MGGYVRNALDRLYVVVDIAGAMSKEQSQQACFEARLRVTCFYTFKFPFSIMRWEAILSMGVPEIQTIQLSVLPVPGAV